MKLKSMTMMKHLFAAALIVGASANLSAQNDQAGPSQDPLQQQPSSHFNARDYTVMKSSDVPQSLRTTLQGDSYKGWEGGKIYRRKNGDGYYLSMGSGNNVQHYYFDKSGKAVEKGAASDRGQGSSSDGGVRSGSDAGSNNDADAGSTGETSSGSGSGSSGSSERDKPKQ